MTSRDTFLNQGGAEQVRSSIDELATRAANLASRVAGFGPRAFGHSPEGQAVEVARGHAITTQAAALQAEAQYLADLLEAFDLAVQALRDADESGAATVSSVVDGLNGYATGSVIGGGIGAGRGYTAV